MVCCVSYGIVDIGGCYFDQFYGLPKTTSIGCNQHDDVRRFSFEYSVMNTMTGG